MGVYWAILIPKRTTKLLDQLHREHLLFFTNQENHEVSDEQLKGIKSLVEEQSRKWAHIGGLIGFAVYVFITLIILFFPGLFGSVGRFGNHYSNQLLNTIHSIGFLIFLGGELVFGYVIGYYLGFAASNGRLQRFLEEKHILIKANPHHLDNVAGFKPLGRFYFYQAIILAFAALFFAVWWYLMNVWPFAETYYAPRWRTAYFVLFVMVLIGEWLAFAVPMWFIHLHMQEQKEEFQREADRWSNPNSSLSEEERKKQKRRYDEIQNMPTWPMETRGIWTSISTLIFPLLLGTLFQVLASKIFH